MAGISLGGVNLDVQGMVSQLMNIERQPLNKLQKQKSDYQTQLSEMGRFRSSLSKFQSAMTNLSSLDKFELYKASTSESGTAQSFSVTTDNNAVGGIYTVNVQNLARGNKFGSTTGFADQDTTTFAATANLDISDGTDSMSIDINGKTLQQIRDEINSSASTGNVGVSASIVKENSGSYQLVITSTDTGLSNQALVTSTGNALTQLDLTEKQTALDATVKIDGYTVTSASNTIADAVTGVSLDLKTVSAADATLTIEKDIAGVTDSVNQVISSYNELTASMKVYEAGSLKGDSSFNSIRGSLRNVLNTSAGLTSAYNYLSEIGVTTNAVSGELELDSTVLSGAVNNDYNAVAQLFAESTNGVAVRMENTLDSILKYDGMIKAREEGINSRIKLNESRQLNLEYRMEKLQANYIKQFSALDGLISQMNSTSTSLAGQLAALPGAR